VTIPDSDFGERVRRHLSDDIVVWLTTIGADGTPQPNPVWFLWDGGDSVLVYNDKDAARLKHLSARPEVSLNFGGDGQGGDIVVIAGTATLEQAAPPPDQHPEYLAKYDSWITRLGTDAAGFAARWSVPMRIRFRKVRGH
jgi:PPOX class probable F420-dependent enzyme